MSMAVRAITINIMFANACSSVGGSFIAPKHPQVVRPSCRIAKMIKTIKNAKRAPTAIGIYRPPTTTPETPKVISVSPSALTMEREEGRPNVESADFVGLGEKNFATPLITKTSHTTKKSPSTIRVTYRYVRI